MAWWDEPGYQRPAASNQRDAAKGWPIISKHGWWCIAGWDERCPVCGDIERFDFDGTLVRRFSTLLPVTPNPDIVVSMADLRALVAMVELMSDLTPRESMAIQRAKAALLHPTGG